MFEKYLRCQSEIEIVEVGPRDGFQSIPVFIPTVDKISIARGLLDCGIRRLETSACVSPKAVPQMSDCEQVLTGVATYARQHFPETRLSVLIATANGGARALSWGATELVFVLSVSESHNQSNVRRSVEASLLELQQLIDNAPNSFSLRLNLATSFDCPFDGSVPDSQVSSLLEKILPVLENRVGTTEIGLCDTTGKALPQHVKRLCLATLSQLSGSAMTLAFHGHDTFGFGIANALMAVEAGVTVLDSAVAGLGGCPFAPGASGNTATEDLVYTLESSGISTGIELAALLQVADRAAAIEGSITGGHMRVLPRQRLLSSNPVIGEMV